MASMTAGYRFERCLENCGRGAIAWRHFNSVDTRLDPDARPLASLSINPRDWPGCDAIAISLLVANARQETSRLPSGKHGIDVGSPLRCPTVNAAGSELNLEIASGAARAGYDPPILGR